MKIKDEGHSEFRTELNKFAEILGLHPKLEDDFDKYVEFLIDKYHDKINSKSP